METMILEVTETEVRLLKALLKKELTHVKTQVKLVKIFDLQNKLNELNIPVVIEPLLTCKKCKTKAHDLNGFLCYPCWDKKQTK